MDNILTSISKVIFDPVIYAGGGSYSDYINSLIDRNINIMYDSIRDKLKERDFVERTETEEGLELRIELAIFTSEELRRYREQVIDQYLLEHGLKKPSPF